MMKKYIFILLLLHSLSSHAQLTLEWAKPLGGSRSENVTDIVTDHLKNNIAFGSFQDTVTFDSLSAAPALIAPAPGSNFIAKYDSTGNLLWAGQIGGAITDADVDSLGNIYVAGYFNDIKDFDPMGGTVYLNSGSAVHDDVFVIKISPAGAYLWGFNIGAATENESVYQVHVMQGGKLLVSGGIGSGTVDLDPSPGVLNVNPVNGHAYLLQCDLAGNFIWGKNYHFSPYYDFQSIVTDASHNIYLCGTFMGTVDFDPSGATLNITASGSFDSYVCKLDPTGNLSWVKHTGNTLLDEAVTITMTDAGQLVVLGRFAGNIDVDPSPAVVTCSAPAGGNYLVSFDPSGNYLWSGVLDGFPTSSEIQSKNGALYVVGDFDETMDFNPGLGVNTISPLGYDCFVAKYDNDGHFIWVNTLPSVYGANHFEYTVNENGKIIVAGGFSGTIDLDPTASNYNIYNPTAPSYSNFFIACYDQQPCYNTALVVDSIQNVSCAAPGYGSASVLNAMGAYTITWSTTPATTDSVAVFTEPGIYTLAYADGFGCALSTHVVVQGPEPIGYDVAVNVVAPVFQPGVTATIGIHNMINTCSALSGEYYLVLDSHLTYITASPAPDNISGDTLFWSYSNLTYDSIQPTAMVQVQPDSTLMAGDQVCLSAAITPSASDLETTNNTRHYCFPVVASYDPNDKQVYPQGVNANHGILKNQTMTYTVRFQNTGTADAINIYILDTLDAHLDLNSAHVIGSSHYMFTEVLPGNVLRFNFPNIHLPDSTSNEPESHGYVIYEIDQLPNLPHNTVIENTAAIYFDYNEPVITNTVFNTIDQGATIQLSENNLCAGDSSVLTLMPNVPGYNGNWQWHSGSCAGPLIASGNTLIATPLTSTSYYLYDTVSNLCFDTLIAVNTVDVSLTATHPSITALATPATYQWVDCNAGFAPYAGETNQQYIATANGSYAVIVTQNGCSDTSECYVYSNIGVNEMGFTNGISIYPNPVSNELNIVFEKATEADIVLTDVTGKTILHTVGADLKSVLNTAHLETGVYLLTITTGNEKTVTRVVKQ